MSEQALELQITSNATSAIEALDKLVSTLGNIQTAVQNGFDASGISKQMQAFSEAIQNAVPEETVQKLERISGAINNLKSVGNVKIKIAADSANATIAQSMGSTMEQAKESAVEVSEATTQAASGMEEAGEAAKKASSGIKEYSDSIKKAASESKKSSGFISNLVRSFGRIAFYRAIRSAIKAVTDGFREGVTNVKKYSEAIGSGFAQDMNSAAASLSTLKNSVGAAVAPALQSLLPILSAITSFAITAFNALNQLFSLLRGGGSWTRATASMNDYTKAAKGAGGATKDLLADWDELNIIQSQGGGGGGGSDIDYTDMFEEVEEYDSKLKSIISWMQDHLDIVNATVAAIGAGFMAWGFARSFGMKLLDTVKFTLGIATAVLGAVYAFQVLKKQFDNGINWDNVTKAIAGSAIAVLGLALAFGKLGLGWGLLGFGVALAINPIKELVETGQLSEAAMAQLAVAVAAVAGGFALLVTKGNIIKAGRILLGIGIAAYGAIKAYKEFKNQFEKGIDLSNSLKLIGELFAVVLGLSIAFGKLGAGWGLLGVGIALAVNPIKELIETGKLSSVAMFQLALGLGAFAAGIALLATKSIPKAIKWFAGIALVVYGVGEAFKTVKQQLEEGVNYDNFLKLFTDLKIAAAGLLVLFGVKGLGAGLIASGIIEAIAPIKEFIGEINSGKDAISSLRDISDEAFAQLETGLIEIGIGVSLLTGNWIPAAVAGVVAIVAWATREWDNIVGAFKDGWEGIGTWFYNNVTMPIINFFIDMVNNVLDTINTIITFINNTLGTSYELNAKIPRMEALKTEVEKASEPITPESAGPKRKKNITGTATEDQLRGYTEAVHAVTDANKEALKSQEDFARELQQSIGDFDLSDYDNLEEALKAINEQLEQNKFVLDEATQQTDDGKESVSEYTEALKETTDVLGEQEPQSVVIPVEAHTVIQQADETMDFGYTYDAETEKPLPLVVPIDLQGEVATGSIDDLYDDMYRALLEYNPDTSTLNTNEFYDFLYESFIQPLGESAGLAEDEIGEIADQFYDNWIQKLFDEDSDLTITDLMDNLKESIESPGEIALPAVNVSQLTCSLDDAATSAEASVSKILNSIARLSGIKLGGLSFGSAYRVSSPMRFAEGGFPTTGDLFIANEAGPELVGRMGNRTAVVNTPQIVEGVASGVAAGQAEQNALLRQQNEYLRRILAKESTVKVEPSASWGRFNKRSEEMRVLGAGA